VDGDILRVRMNLLVSGGTLSTSSQGFKLQYASTTGKCTSSLNWIDISSWIDYFFSPDPKQGSGTFDDCGTQNSDDYIDWVQIESKGTGTLHVKIKWWPSSSGFYTEDNGIHLKAFHYDGSIWREIYSNLMAPADFTIDNRNYDEFDYTISATSTTVGTNYIRASLIDRKSSSDEMTGHCASESSGTDGGIGRHYDNDDVSFLVNNAEWIGYDNPTPADGATTSDHLLASSTVAESYEKYNPSEKNLRAIPQDGQGEWDWVIQDDGAPG